MRTYSEYCRDLASDGFFESCAPGRDVCIKESRVECDGEIWVGKSIASVLYVAVVCTAKSVIQSLNGKESAD
jgi:hypothetical protein